MAVKFTQKEYQRLEEIAGRTVSCQPFLEDNPEKKRTRIKKVNADGFKAFSYFAKEYFPHVVTLDFCSAHRYIFNVIEKNPGVTGITGFRGLGKTAAFGFIYPIWKIIKGEKYLIFGAANIDQAVEKVDFIINELENNIRLISDFPEIKKKDQIKSNIFLMNNTKIRPISIKQPVRGTINSRVAKRPGLIILDDIDVEENVGNPLIGDKKKKKICQEIRGSLDPKSNGKVLWLGNITHPNFAIYQFKKMIIEEIKVNKDNVNEYATCLYGNNKRLLQIPLEKNGKSTWESQYPTSMIPEIKADYGMTGFLREMQGRALIDGMIFKAHWFTTGTFPADKDMKIVWLYTDPAWGKKGCYRSVIAIGFDGKKYYVLKVWVRQCENSKMYAFLYDVYSELKNRFKERLRAGFEANFGQDRHYKDFDEWATAQNLNPISHFFKKIYNSENKFLRIEALESVIESTKIVFPEGQDMPTLIGQFTSYPKGYIDGCDALAGCMERFNGFKRSKGVRARSIGGGS
jgi:hypothetical protein